MVQAWLDGRGELVRPTTTSRDARSSAQPMPRSLRSSMTEFLICLPAARQVSLREFTTQQIEDEAGATGAQGVADLAHDGRDGSTTFRVNALPTKRFPSGSPVWGVTILDPAGTDSATT